MRKPYFFLAILCALTFYSYASPFTPGNLVIVRVGDGVTGLSGAAAPVFLDEYTKAGVLVQSIPLPTTASGPSYALTISGTGISEGYISISPNDQYLSITGYDAAPGTAAVSGTSSSSNTTTNPNPVRRVVGMIDYNGNVNTTTGLLDTYSGESIRSAVTTNGTNIWMGGPSGVRYTTIGSSSSSPVSSTASPSVNARVVNIYNNQLYISSNSNSYNGINTVGSGVPGSSGQTVVLQPGFTATTASTPPGPNLLDPYGFSVSPDSKTIYVANFSNGPAGGVQKWIYNTATSQYEYQYTMNVTANVGIVGLVVDWFSNAVPVIYATSYKQISGSESRLYRITDNGTAAASTYSILATAGTGAGATALTQSFRGIAFTPYTYLLPVQLLSFTATAQNNKTLFNWKTASELNTSRFEIEQSSNGTDFKPFATVHASGNSNTEKNYTYTGSLNPATTYYRLKMIDADGKFTRSSVVKIVPATTGFTLGNIYPVPAKNVIIVDWNSNHAGATLIRLTDISGRTLYTTSVQAVQGFNQAKVDVQSLAAGQYFLQLKNDKAQLQTMITKQ